MIRVFGVALAVAVIARLALPDRKDGGSTDPGDPGVEMLVSRPVGADIGPSSADVGDARSPAYLGAPRDLSPGLDEQSDPRPEAPPEQQSLWRAFSEARHAVVGLTPGEAAMPTNHGVLYFAQNPGQKICARFLQDSVRITSGRRGDEWQVSFRPLDLPEAARVVSSAARVEYQRDTITEWFENRPEGIDHGFTVREPVTPGDQLRIELGIEGAACEAGPEGSIILRDDSGKALLSYAKPHAWDATGRPLPARMEPVPGGIGLFVEATEVLYPVTIDPLITSLVQTLGPEITGVGQEDDAFGVAVAIEGDTALIGASEADTVRGSLSGIVYVFTRSGNAWTQSASLLGSDTFGNHRFGGALDLDGDRAVIGAWNASNTGAAYVFRRTSGTWSQEARLPVSGLGAFDYFGRSVAISGDHVVVGASGDDDAGSASGKAYIYQLSGGSWLKQADLAPADLESLDEFGRSVSIDGFSAVVGARRGSISGVDSGSAYVFVFNGTKWEQQVELGPADGAVADFFGSSVSISGDRIAVGSNQDDNFGNDSGSAYVFSRIGGVWEQEAKLVPTDSESGDRFGSAVSMDGNRVIVGAPWADETGNLSGSAYIFGWNGSSWSQQAKLVGSATGGSSFSGNSVALAGTTALVGAGGELGASLGVTGSAYVFDGLGSVWNETARIVLSGDSAAGDRFGTSLALEGDTALIGAVDDNTPAGADVGTAYVMIRVGGVWSNQARLAAADGAAGDKFGISVSLSGDTAVVGAYLDDVNDSTYNSGSAYVFVRSGGFWSQQAKLLPADIESLDYFGIAVDVDGDLAVVGSYWDRARRGSAYAFHREGAVWRQEAKFFDPSGGSEDNYGWSVAVTGNTVFAAAPWADRKGNRSGAVFVHTRSATGVWTEEGVLLPSDGAEGGSFGYALAMDGNRVLISGGGGAYVFSRAGAGWSEDVKLEPIDGTVGTGFAMALDLSDGVAVIGAPRDDVGASDAGSVHLFKEAAGEWSPKGVTRSPNPGFLYYFGGALALDGDTLFVGAPGEDGFSLTGTPADSQGRVYVYRLDEASRISITVQTLAPVLVAGGQPQDILRFTATNFGATPASRVVFQELAPLPSGLRIVRTGASAGNFTSRRWLLALQGGQSATLTLTLQADVSAAAGDFSYGLDLAESTPPDVTPEDNQAVAQASVISGAWTGVEATVVPNLERQSGLLVGKVRISNNNSTAIPAFRLYVNGLPSGATVVNASGVGGTESLPYLLYNRTLEPNASVELTVEIHVPNRATGFTPDFVVELLNQPEPVPEPSGMGLAPSRIARLWDGSLMVEFSSESGATYRVEHSPDLLEWRSAAGEITASANRLQWIDNGPPKTEPHPSKVSSRYYRLVKISSAP